MNQPLVVRLGIAALAIILFALIVWFRVRPAMEAAVIEVQSRTMQGVAAYTIPLAEQILHENMAITHATAATIAGRPRDGEGIIRVLMEHHADLLMARIHSPSLSDELLVRNPATTADSISVAEDRWMGWDADTSVQVALISGPADSLRFAARTRLRIAEREFFLTTLWAGDPWQRLYTTIPADTGALIHIAGKHGIIWKNWDADSVGLSERVVVRERFVHFPLEIAIAFTVSPVIGPVRSAMQELLIGGFLMILLPSLAAILFRRSSS